MPSANAPHRLTTALSNRAASPDNRSLRHELRSIIGEQVYTWSHVLAAHGMAEGLLNVFITAPHRLATAGSPVSRVVAAPSSASRYVVLMI